MAAIPQPIEPSLLARTIEHLELLSREGDEEEIIRKLASIVPGYQEEHYDDQSTLAKNMKSRKGLRTISGNTDDFDKTAEKKEQNIKKS
jgi:hypothetical protein